jgi:hypothetical protein
VGDHQVWAIARDAGRHLVEWSGDCLLTGAKIAPPAPVPAGIVRRAFDGRPASASTYARWTSSYAHPSLSFQRNSTLQHYDAIETIALGAQNCVCMFAETSAASATNFLYVQIFIIRRSCSPPLGEQVRALCPSATNRV